MLTKNVNGRKTPKTQNFEKPKKRVSGIAKRYMCTKFEGNPSNRKEIQWVTDDGRTTDDRRRTTDDGRQTQHHDRNSANRIS